MYMQMISNPLLHPSSKIQLDTFIGSPQQSVLLVADEHANYMQIAEWAADLLARGQNIAREYIQIVTKDAKASSISIDQIHTLLHSIKYKHIAQGAIIVIQDADTMSTEAQNRLLKTLEEPGLNVYFILTSAKPEQILATIRSRTSILTLKNPTKEQYASFYKHTNTSEEIMRAYMLSSGAYNMFEAILNKKEDESVNIAKQIISVKAFERLSHVDRLAKDKQLALHVLDVLIRIYTSLLRSAAQKEDRKQLQAHTTRLELTEQTYNAIISNSNSKLALTRLFIKI